MGTFAQHIATQPLVLAWVWPLGAGEVWTLACLIVCAIACALPGVFLVLRRMSMLGDAISHAVLPGLVIAFLISSSRSPLVMLVGAALAGMASAGVSAALTKARRVREDAALGVSFSLFFATGVVLISLYASSVDLDPGCVLYGLAELIPLDTEPYTILGHVIEVPRSFPWLLGAVLVNVGMITLFYKELRITTFDAGLASALGFTPWAIQAGLLAATAATSVVSFEVLGSILVIAMLVAPGATAHMLTDRLGRMLWYAALFATTAATLGYIVALFLETNIAGMVASTAGVQFGLAVIFAPRYGIASKFVRRVSLSVRIAREDILSALYRTSERATPDPTRLTLASESGLLPPINDSPNVVNGSRLVCALARRSLRSRGLASINAQGELSLTTKGHAMARDLVRSHRLWELYLSRSLGLPADHVHAPSHRVEHFITPAIEALLLSELPANLRVRDPHGAPIPSKD